MTTETVLAFIFAGITALVAIVAGIWLEARMPAPQPQRTGPPSHLRPPGPADLLSNGDRVGLRHPARTGSFPAAGTTGNGPAAVRPAPP